jgi:hypothetical protein
MAFNLDFSHIPSSLAIPIIPSSPQGISDVSRTLVDKITTDPGGLFSNPMINSVNVLGDSTTQIETRLKSISDGSLTDASISQLDATNFLSTDPFQDIRTSMGNFMMHTDRLSGLLKSQGIQAPGLQQILSIGTQMQNMMTLLQASSGCLAVLGGCTGLFSQDTFSGFTGQMNGVLTRMERGAATIADIAQTLSVVANLVRGIADKDSQFLQNCVNQLQAASVALVMEALNSNPCTQFVFQQISNKNPGGLLNVLSKAPQV